MTLYQPKDLPIPEDVRAAAKMGRLAFFIGAGVSRLYGLPSWEELANKMLIRLAECRKLNHSLVDLLLKYPTKVKISIADHYFKENRKAADENRHQNLTYYSVLMDGISREEIHKKIPIYTSIAKCNVKLITTNYDSLLSDVLSGVTSSDSVIAEGQIETAKTSELPIAGKNKTFDYKIFKSLDELEESSLTKNNILVHLHGSLSNEGTLIASTQSYLKFYGNKSNQDRLNLLFKKQTIVFFGYGLEELEILDLLLKSSSSESDSQDSPRFFLVLSLLSHEMEILKHLQIYYDQLGVKLLAFSRDAKGYHALTDVLEEWTKTLIPIVEPPSQADHSFVMEQLRKQFNEVGPMTLSKEHIVKEMVKLITNSPKDEASFFEEEKNYKWFEVLIPHGFFQVGTIKPRVIEEESFHYPYWPQGVYIETIAKQIHDGTISDEDFIKNYLEALRTLFSAKDNLWAISAIFRSVFLVPAKYLFAEDVVRIFEALAGGASSNNFIEFDIHESYFHIIKKIEDNDHDRSVFREFTKHFLSSKSEDRFGIRERKLVFFKDHRFQHFADQFLKEAKASQASVKKDIIAVVTELLSEHLKKENIDKTTTLWRPAVEAHHQNQFKDSAPSIFVSLLYEISKMLLATGEIPIELQGWKASDKNTLTRIYIALATSLPEVLDRDKCAERILGFGLKYQLRYEIYHFFEKHFDSLNTTNQSGILKKIETLTSQSAEENDPQGPRLTAWEKIRWLHAIKQSKNEEAKKLYDEVFKITNSEPDHPDFDSYMSPVRWGFDSPLSIEDFDQLIPSEIIQKISEFKEKKDRFGEPLAERLSRIFESFVTKEPVKCSALIKDVLTLPAIYVSSLFDGYTKCWTEKKFVPVDELIELAENAFNNQSFRAELVEKESKARWAANSIFRFISAGVRDDSLAFDPKFNNKCHEILKIAVLFVKPDDDYKGSSDAFTRAINEPRGVLFEAAILLALRQARLSYDNVTSSITNATEIKKAWTGLLEIIKGPLELQDENEVSLHAHIGALYRQFLFLDKDWLYKNLGLVCPPDDQNQALWSAFMQGFCYVSVYIKEMYFYLNNKDYLLKFLRLESDVESGTRINTLQEHIIRLATISVMLKDETLADGLLKKILDSHDGDEWNSVIRSLPRLVGEDPEDDIVGEAKKIISFLLDKFESIQDKANWKRHFEGAGWLLEVFKDPSDALVERIIKIAAYYSKAHWDHYEIVKYLEPFKDSHTEVVGKLYLDLLRASSGYPAYPEEKIVGICSSLKSKGKKEILADICRIYSNKLPNSKLTKRILELV
jgi:flagellin-specific chaperone FliS